MIEHIHERLMRWAGWAAGAGRARGLGYPPCCLSRLAEVDCSGVRQAPDIDEEAGETDAGVALMPADMREVVKVFYLHRGTVEQKARDLSVGKKTLYLKLEAAQGALAKALEELAERKWRVRSVFSRSECVDSRKPF